MTQTKPRRLYIAANWKMNMTLAGAKDLATGVRSCAEPLLDRIDAGIFPPFPLLATVQEALQASGIVLGAQNLHWEESGAYSGEVSAAMIKDFGAGVIIGHSERRSYFGDTDEWVNRKLRSALAAGLDPIVCVGETEAERETGQTKAVLSRQVREGLKDVAVPPTLVIAYEPVWAIGTGKSADPPTAVAAIAHIRDEVTRIAGRDVADRVRIQYGGSVTPENIGGFLREEQIDGALVGGASLKVDAFCAILREAASLA